MRAGRELPGGQMDDSLLPPHTPLSYLPAGKEIALGRCLLGARPCRGLPQTPGIELGFPSRSQEPCLQILGSLPSRGASPSLSLAQREQQGDPLRPQVCKRPRRTGPRGGTPTLSPPPTPILVNPFPSLGLGFLICQMHSHVLRGWGSVLTLTSLGGDRVSRSS